MKLPKLWGRKSGGLETPVVLLVYNRPELTRRVFEVVSQARPKRLLIIADGPKSGDSQDQEKVTEVREIVESVDWTCRVLKNYSAENLGCFERIVSGLDWVFDQVEDAVILEDDCLPHPSFFTFCEELLCRFREDERIFAIRGSEYPCPEAWTDYSYYFSKHFNPNGWATWKRTWKSHDPGLSHWPEFKKAGGFESLLDDVPGEAEFFREIMEAQNGGAVTKHWDWGMQSTCWAQNRLVVTPRVNLVTDIGYGEGATHIGDATDPRANLPNENIGDLRHPLCVVRNREADIYKFRYDHQFISGSTDEKQRGEGLETRILHLEAQLEAKESLIQQQHRDLVRLQTPEEESSQHENEKRKE